MSRRESLQEQKVYLTKLQRDKNQLLYALKRAQTEEFVEERARKLSLTKKDEYILIAPRVSPTPVPIPTKTLQKAIYKQWLHVFINP